VLAFGASINKVDLVAEMNDSDQLADLSMELIVQRLNEKL
jgi:hypothetical protein